MIDHGRKQGDGKSKRTLLIKPSHNSFELAINKLIIDENCDVVDAYSFYSSEQNRIKICISSLKREKKILSLKDLKKYEKIIVFDDFYIMLWVSLYKNRNCRLNLWYWNILRGKNYWIKLKTILCKMFCKVWTFDRGEAIKYKLNWNSQFYFDIENKEITNNATIYFVGADKGRFAILKKLIDYLQDVHIPYDFNMKVDQFDQYPQEYRDILINDFIEYDVNLSKIRNCGAVLDLVQKEQTGLTMRVMEAVFLNKKIITNNIRIIDEICYEPKMVFILGRDSIEGLKSFMQQDDLDYGEEVRKYYSFEKWLSRFD